MAAEEDGPYEIEELTRAASGCALRPYPAVTAPEFSIAGEFITYASPDATYAVTRRLIEAAKDNIVVGIYDFTSVPMRDLLLAAVARGVKVSVMLDLDHARGTPEDEDQVWSELKAGGCEGVPAPSCRSRYVHYFINSHEKVIVIDDEWCLVQSGNYTNASCPFNEADGAPPAPPARFAFGNRDMGVAVRAPEMAAWFKQVLQNDMQLELNAEAEARGALPLPAPPPPLLAVRAPRRPPPLHPSRSFVREQPVRVAPVLSPDNYMQVVPAFLAAATTSIYIEQQYIKAGQPLIRQLLAAIQSAAAAHPGLDVRIVLAVPIGEKPAVTQANQDALAGFGLEMGTNVRYLSPEYFTHCHNKLIIVDGAAVLVSSQNWSDTAVSQNREAGLVLYDAAMATYFSDIFAGDWESGLQAAPRRPATPAGATPAEGLRAAGPAEIAWLEPGDYAEV